MTENDTTRDGVAVVFGMPLYFNQGKLRTPRGVDVVCEQPCYAIECGTGAGPLAIFRCRPCADGSEDSGDWSVLISDCYSTREAAREAASAAK